MRELVSLREGRMAQRRSRRLSDRIQQFSFTVYFESADSLIMTTVLQQAASKTQMTFNVSEGDADRAAHYCILIKAVFPNKVATIMSKCAINLT